MDVSVVMSVYDEPEHVRKTVDSVLAQKGVEFEFIIISDGASDGVLNVLESYQDPRIKLIKQANQGLTKALIMGCDLAKAPFIARIDAGDIMLESRLYLQSKVLKEQADVAMVSSWVGMETEEGYFLYDVKLNEQELNTCISSCNEDDIKTPVHSSVMFRKVAYYKAEGYRHQFYYSQDCDLWPRIIIHGKLVLLEKKLTSCIFSASGISGRHSETQKKMKALVAQANVLRKGSQSEHELLCEAEKLRPVKSNLVTKNSGNDYAGNYFIAKVLLVNKSESAYKYWLRTVRLKPFDVKSWFFLMQSTIYILCRFKNNNA